MLLAWPLAHTMREKRKTNLAHLAFGVILLVCISCGGRRVAPFEGQVYRSGSFEYHEEETSTALCPDLLPLLDTHLADFEALTGRHLTPPAFEYYHFASESGRRSYGCGTDCTIDQAVYAVDPFASHELFHAYAHRAIGSAPSIGLLEEGLATAFACLPVRSSNGSWGLDWHDVLHVAEATEDLYDIDIEDQYAAAGAFVAYLYYTFGWDRLALLYGAIHRRDDVALFERAVQSLYGTDMDSLWRDSQILKNRRICIGDWTCRSAPLLLGKPARQACDGEIHKSLELSQTASVAVFTTNPVMLWEDCLAEPGPSAVLGHNMGPSVSWVSLPPGKFSLTKTSGSRSINAPYYPESFSLQLLSEIPGDLLATSCKEALTIPLDPRTQTRILFPPTLSLNGWVGLDGSAGGTFSVTPYQLLTTPQPGMSVDAAPGDISLCDGCSADATCRSIAPDAGFFLAGTGIMRLTNVYAMSSPDGGFPNAAFVISPM